MRSSLNRRSTLYGTQQELINQQRLLREQQRQQEMVEIKTVVKQEKDKEVFITDAEDIDFDKLNEQHMQEIYKEFNTENQVRWWFSLKDMRARLGL